MQQVIYQKDNKIEIALSGNVTKNDFNQIIHQWESMCTMHPHINVLLDTADAEKLDFKIIWDEYEFYKKYKQHLKRFALVSDKKVDKFFVNQFNKFSDTEFKTFPPDKVKTARKWIFPSPLP